MTFLATNLNDLGGSAGRVPFAVVNLLCRGIGFLVESLRRPGRLLALAWLLGLLTVGAAGMAHADGLFSHPTYTDSQPTLFEAHGPFAYSLTIQPDDDAQ